MLYIIDGINIEKACDLIIGQKTTIVHVPLSILTWNKEKYDARGHNGAGKKHNIIMNCEYII